MSELYCPTCGRPLLAGAEFCDLEHGDRGAVAGLTRAAIERTPRAWRHLLGLTIAGAWRTDGFLGAGGMGVVLSAVQLSVSRTVALKLLPMDAQTDADMLRRFEREARLMASLTDPNLVMLFDFGETSVGPNPEDRLFYIAMERVEGPTLTEALNQHGAFGTPEALALGANMLRGLAAAHEAGVVHRDLKPGNVMIDLAKRRPNFARLIDFGISSLHGAGGAQTLAARGGVMGTPKYMAPEQWRAEPADPSTDVYAFGAMLVELLTGAPPIPKGEPREMALAHCTGPRPVLTVDGAGQPITPALARFIDRCMAIDREARYPHATAALDALLSIDAGADAEVWPSVPAFEAAPEVSAPAASPRPATQASLPPGRRPAEDPALAALLQQDWDAAATGAPVSRPPRGAVADPTPLAPATPAPASSAPASSGPASSGPAPSAPASSGPASSGPAPSAPAGTSRPEAPVVPWGAASAAEPAPAEDAAPADDAGGWLESWSTALATEAAPILNAGVKQASEDTPPAAARPVGAEAASAAVNGADDADEWRSPPAASTPRAAAPAGPDPFQNVMPTASSAGAVAPGPARDSRQDETWGVTGTALPPAPAGATPGARSIARGPTSAAAANARGPGRIPSSWIAAGIAFVVVVGGLVVWRVLARDEVAEAAAKAVTPYAVPPSLPDAAPPSTVVSVAPIPGPRDLPDNKCVIVSVRPGNVKFVQVPDNTLLCENTNICRVPIDVDTRLELAGHEPKVLSGDDLYDRRGGRWSIVLQPLQTGKAKRNQDR